MTHQESADRVTVDDLIAPGTPSAIADWYRGLREKADGFDLGLLGDDVVILDTETTGLSFRDCELIEVAAARLEGGEVRERFQSFIKPVRPIPPEISALTHITPGDVVDAPRAEEVIRGLEEFVGGVPIVAHNATFDRTFVEKVKGGSKVSDLWIDSLALSRIALPRLTSHSLKNLAEAFGCDAVSHRAMDDVDALAGVWRVLIAALADAPQGFLRLMAEAHPEVQWPYRPLFAYLAAERQDGPFDLAGLRRDLLAKAPARPRKDARDLVDVLRPVSKAEVDALFAPNGPVASALAGSGGPRFEPRPGQVHMAEAVTEAVDSGSDLVVEAPTGVGKSLAYLGPLALYAHKNQVTCGVATKTNALTDQLVGHDLPLLAQTMPGLTWSHLKGYDHYPCLSKVERALLLDLPEGQVQANGRSANTVRSDMLTALAVTIASVAQSPEGDLDSLGIRWGSVPRTLLTTTPQECRRQKCRFFNGGCLLHGARRRAAAADIVVTNHSLLLRDVASDGRILPPIRHWVVDEAHSFDEEARRQWALEASAAKARQGFEQLGDLRSGSIKALWDETRGTDSGELVGRLLSKTAASAARASVASSSFFESVREFVSKNRGSGGYDLETLWVGADLRQRPDWQELAQQGLGLVEKLEETVRFGRDAQTQAVSAAESAPGDVASLKTDLGQPLRDLEEVRDALLVVLNGSEEGYVCSVSANLGKRRQGEERLSAERLDVGAELAQRWYPETMSATFCSATMAVGEDFKHFDENLGLDRLPEGAVRHLQLPSGYDFDDAMAVLVPTDLPDPYDRAYIPKLADALYDIHVAMDGSVLTLFTNRRDMERVFAILEPRLRDAGLTLYQQERRSNMARLRRQFIEEEASSLFALKSFWEGFDAAGDTLRCVVVPKLPFANPNDPLVREREAQDRRSWWRHSLPDAVLEVKQAAGRLVRSSTDAGILVLGDNRLLTKRYGKQFLNSLPSRNVTTLQAQHLTPYIEMWRRSHSR